MPHRFTLFADGPSWQSWDVTLSGCAVLVSYLDAEKHIEDQAMATFLAATFIARSRYNKLTLQIATQGLTPPIRLPSQVFDNFFEIAAKAGWLNYYSPEKYLYRYNAGGSFVFVFVV